MKLYLAIMLSVVLAVSACGDKKPKEFKNGKWVEIEQEAPLSTPTPEVADAPAAAPGVTSQPATTPAVPAQPQPQVIVQQQSSSPWMWGFIGYMLGSSSSRTERVIEREVRYVPTPAPSQSAARAAEPKSEPSKPSSSNSKPSSYTSTSKPASSSSSSSNRSSSSSYSSGSSSRSSSSYSSGSSSRSSSSSRR